MIRQLGNKDGTIEWTEEMTKELDKIKNQLKGNPKLPTFDQEFSLYTDESARSLGWYLMEGNVKHERILTMGHRTLMPNEQKMSTTDRELTALDLAAKKIKYVMCGMERLRNVSSSLKLLK